MYEKEIELLKLIFLFTNGKNMLLHDIANFYGTFCEFLYCILPRGT